MLFIQLALSEEQADSVREIFADEKEVMSLLFARHGLEYQDMQQLRREMKIFRTQSPEKLSAVLNHEQRLILRREIIASGPLEFLQLSEEGKFAFVQGILELSSDDAALVAAILDENTLHRENLLYDLGFNPVEMIALRQDMENHCQELNQSLSEILDEEQMEQLETLSSAMKPWNRGHARSVTFQEDN